MLACAPLRTLSRASFAPLRVLLLGVGCVLSLVFTLGLGFVQAQEPPTPEQDLSLGHHAFSPSPNQNFTLAARHLLRAAKAGSQAAQALTGYLYLHGLGVPKNTFWASYWLEQALGHPEITEQERALAQGWLDQAKGKR